jgi:hypothetical protein
MSTLASLGMGYPAYVSIFKFGDYITGRVCVKDGAKAYNGRIVM